MLVIIEKMTYCDRCTVGTRTEGNRSRRIDNDLDIAKELVRTNLIFKAALTEGGGPGV
jgi:hypothetical protein